MCAGGKRSHTQEGSDFSGGSVARTPSFQCRGLSLIPGQGTRSHVLRCRVQMPLKIPCAAATTWHSQINTLKSIWERREVRGEMQGDGSTKTHPGNKWVKLKRVVDKRSLSLASVISIQKEDSISLGPLLLPSRPQFSHMVTTEQISSYSFDFYCLAHNLDSKYPTLYDSIPSNTIIPKCFVLECKVW